MGLHEFTKSGAFGAIVFALVVVLVPFGIEQVAETTGWFDFPVKKTVTAWFSFGGDSLSHSRALAPVDWERYRQDIEAFTKWVDGQKGAVISLPPAEEVVIKVKEDEEAEE